MDDRESIYLDTISLASEYPNRKSMSLSRQTIYHSAEDVHQDNGGGIGTNSTSSPGDYSTPMSMKRKASLKSDQQRHTNIDLIRLAGCDGAGPNDEVSARLLFNNNKTVTYTQWKSRVTFSLSFSFFFSLIIIIKHFF